MPTTTTTTAARTPLRPKARAALLATTTAVVGLATVVPQQAMATEPEGAGLAGVPTAVQLTGGVKPATTTDAATDAPADAPAEVAQGGGGESAAGRGGPDRAEDGDPGRGAEFDDDGRLVTIHRDDQPKAVPADDGAIDRWINEALDIMDEKDIPGTYDSIHRNLMRESSGDPYTINMWDSNAHKNIPSKGLLQVIDPTFEQYHVPGTSKNIYDPVANIVAACNYAADRYGSMDNVDSAY